MSIVLEIEPLDLGADMKSVGLELTELGTGAPVSGIDGARIWSRVLTTLAGNETWALDFFSHLDRVRDFCARHKIALRDASARSLVIPVVNEKSLAELFERFEGETFGARAGGSLATAGSNGGVDAVLEGELARKGVDAYHRSYANYFFCAVCEPSAGSVTLLSNRLWVG
ncbi:MAG: hypothetical protein HY046_14355, partial [Acidobacteria bacterium]|nr:hypothetical protein [Acidobacteriota bacterium]